MEAISILVPMAVLIVVAMGFVFWWSVRHGQFDDLDAPAYSILVDDDDPEHQKDKKRQEEEKTPEKQGVEAKSIEK